LAPPISLTDALDDERPAPRRRGRPRNEGLRRTILRAAAALLEERGVDGVTIEAIAERAGVGKQTIYRRWSTRAAVLVEAFLTQDENPESLPDTGYLRRDLALFAEQIATAASDAALRRSVAGLVAASHADPEVGRLFRERFVAPARASARVLLERGLARGEVHPDVDLEVTIDELLGAIWYRALISGGRLDRPYADSLSSGLAQGIVSRERAVDQRKRPLRPGTVAEPTIDLFGTEPADDEA
jgi:AcrR family transcriptional regulator